MFSPFLGCTKCSVRAFSVESLLLSYILVSCPHSSIYACSRNDKVENPFVGYLNSSSKRVIQHITYKYERRISGYGIGSSLWIWAYKKALDKTLSIDEETLEVDEELLNAFLLKLVTKVTDDCFELTYFLDLTGEAYLKEDINLNCFDKNYSASYKLPEDYTVFDSFIITKEEADVYASKLNKRSFKSHIWNDIKVNIVLEYSI